MGHAAVDNWSEAEVHDDGSLLWAVTDIPFTVFNSVLRAA